jgi:hypothetical protein
VRRGALDTLAELQHRRCQLIDRTGRARLALVGFGRRLLQRLD